MSIVVAVETNQGKAIAFDSETRSHGSRWLNAKPDRKLVCLADGYIGITGYMVYHNLLKAYIAQQAEVCALHDETAVFNWFLSFWKWAREECHLVDDSSDSDNPSPFADFDSDFLLLNPSGIYRIPAIVGVGQIERYCCIGSGAPHAEGALHVTYDVSGDPVELARQAVGVAIAYDAGCGGNIEFRVLESNC